MNQPDVNQHDVNPLGIAIRQIESARAYTWTLIGDLADDEWFTQVAGMPSHIAWEVGHIAMAQYALSLLRVRGKEPEDQEFMANSFFKYFKKGSIAQPEASGPSLDEIKQTFQAVFDRTKLELPGFSPDLLSESLPEPYFGTPTKLGSILFASHHEMLHAGHIGVLRRLLGKPPVR